MKVFKCTCRSQLVAMQQYRKDSFEVQFIYIHLCVF